jgi:ADP-ribose pyrophosphatase YjhB (NUDIX family)
VTVYTPRRAARVLLLDASDRVLLFAGTDPARELAEETGLRLAPAELGAPVWSETVEFPFDGVWYRQDQEFFLVRVTSWEVDTAGFNDIERASVSGHRWSSLAELAATTERYYPPDLPQRLAGALAAAGSERC